MKLVEKHSSNKTTDYRVLLESQICFRSKKQTWLRKKMENWNPIVLDGASTTLAVAERFEIKLSISLLSIYAGLYSL